MKTRKMKVNNIAVLLVLAVFGAIASCSSIEAEQSSGLSKVLGAQHRTADYVARDQYRHPRATLEFFQVTANNVVVEIWPGGGWYTEILAPLLQDKGKFYAASFPADSSVPYFIKARAKYDAKLAANPAVYSQVVVTGLQPPQNVDIAPEASSDRVLTFRNVHNWMKAGTAEGVFAAMNKALKPGGLLGIVEHRAKPNTPFDVMIKSGYVTEAAVIKYAQDAGFKLIDESEINANKADTKDYDAGVWTLPPSLRLKDKDRAKYLAIGESDRMTLLFEKQ